MRRRRIAPDRNNRDSRDNRRANIASDLVLEHVSRRFGDHVAVDDISLSIRQGEFLSLLGPSGCGKTTLLRMIAGFVAPSAGRIVCAGRDITALPAYARNLGVVFQSYALFPHMTVAENVGYGLKVRGVAAKDIARRVADALDRVSLSHAADKRPSNLSGGMQQRVALARALVIEPDILLLDEPLSALDKNLREDMQVELRLLQKRVGVTTVFVTHDQEEAMTLSDRIAVMQAGKIMQVAAPETIYGQPSSEFVATFLGMTNILVGRIVSVLDRVARFALNDGAEVEATVPARAADDRVDAHDRLAVRPENVLLGPADGRSGLAGTVEDVLFQGHRLIVLFRADGGQTLRSYLAPVAWRPAKGERAVASWRAADASFLSR